MNDLKDKKIVLVTHILADGAPTDLKKYLIPRIKRFLFIGHPFSFAKDKRSFFEFYKDRKTIKSGRIKDYYLPEIVRYIKDLFLTVYWVTKSHLVFDFYIGADNLNTLAGIILRYFGRVKRVIYYTIDYSPRRFKNAILNKIYHFIERYCACRTDLVWNISPRIQEGRIKNGLNPKKAAKYTVVPQGVWYSRIKRLPFEEIEKHTLVFMGNILKKQGIQYILYAIPLVIKEIPDFKFLVIGDGKYLSELKNEVKKLNIKEHVEFTGYIDDHRDIEDMIAKSALAIAPYEKEDKDNEINWTHYADPGKIKVYLGAGVPVLLTDVPFNAKEIERNKCGFVIDYEKETIARKVIDLMKNEERLKQYRKNAMGYAKQFDWNTIFDKALSNF